MTNPPPPPASAMGLVARWTDDADAAHREQAKQHGYEISFCDQTKAETLERCADELSAALSLSEEEREAIKNADKWRGGKHGTDVPCSAKDFDTLRALIARFIGDKA